MTNKLVDMEKDGEHLEVHPTCVKAHEEVGWKVSSADEAAEVKATVKAEAEEKKAAEAAKKKEEDKK